MFPELDFHHSIPAIRMCAFKPNLQLDLVVSVFSLCLVRLKLLDLVEEHIEEVRSIQMKLHGVHCRGHMSLPCMSASERAASGKTHVAMSARLQNTVANFVRVCTGDFTDKCLLGQHERLRTDVPRAVQSNTHHRLALPGKAVTILCKDRKAGLRPAAAT